MRIPLIFATLLNTILAFGQNTIEQKAHALLQKEVLTEKGSKLLMAYAAKNPNEVLNENLLVLEFLSNAFYVELVSASRLRRKIEKKIKQEDPPITFYYTLPLFSSAGDFEGGHKNSAGLIHENRSIFGKTRSRTLADLWAIGLIGSRTFNDADNKLKDSTLVDEGRLVNYVLKREQYYFSYPTIKDKEIQFANQLVTAGLLEESDIDKLRSSYSEFELKGEQSILAFSKHCQIVDLRGLVPNPNIVYTRVFEAVGILIPALQHITLNTSIIEEKEGELVTQLLHLSFEVNNVVYRHKFFHDIKGQENDQISAKKISAQFHKGINKYLADINDPLRLHTINFPDSNGVYGQERIGIILLTEAQADMLYAVIDTNTLSRESFEKKFNSKNLERIVNDFDSIGLFSGLSPLERDSSLQKIFSKEIRNLNDILTEFPNTVVIFDWEAANLENPYEELTNSFAKASRGAFQPMKVEDDFKHALKKKKHVSFAFTFNGKTYAGKLKVTDDWLSPEFMEMIEVAMTENNVDGRFHFCYDNGQENGLIFLTSAQEKFIIEHYPNLLVELNGEDE